MTYLLKYFLSVVLIFLIGIIGYKRKEKKPLKPMGCKTFVPKGYKCLTAKIKTDREISEGVRGYTINAFEGLQVCKTKDGPMNYLPSDIVSEISYNIKNQLSV